MRSTWLVLAMLAVGTGVAAADDRFHAVPDSGGLELRVVSYGHSVHGEMVVEVRNATAQPLLFASTGLYFTPDGNFDAQRLGVVGTLRVGSEGAPTNGINVAAGATRKMRFDVFCIDEHRSAPSTDQAYTLAAARMPPGLIAAIAEQTAGTLAGIKRAPDPMELSSLQGQIWEGRRAYRTRLLGEKRR